ncbi:MAG: glycosyltransferase family 4 protein, partial [Opitutales bacterium]|nr:glycosyltransferase family 4 protein [Opitutales bacterium]
MLNVHFTAGDGKGWALDEDLRQIKASIGGMVRSSGPACADVVHAAYWGNLLQVAPAILRERFVIAHADNPPFYSLKQVEFGLGSQWVDLWVARSTEAYSQFTKLGLPVVHIPYSIDPKLFFPIPDKRALRIKHGLPPDAYLIANFHRDAEGSDLHTPKFQKAPELFVIILKALMDMGHPVHALLAGPRRNWMRRQLRDHGIPFTFIGKDTGERDDFGTNILDRPTLNELTNAADLYLIPSRWEGGPQSVMEAAACRIPVISTPLGVSRDILEPQCLFRSVREAVDCIA